MKSQLSMIENNKCIYKIVISNPNFLWKFDISVVLRHVITHTNKYSDEFLFHVFLTHFNLSEHKTCGKVLIVGTEVYDSKMYISLLEQLLDRFFFFNFLLNIYNYSCSSNRRQTFSIKNRISSLPFFKSISEH